MDDELLRLGLDEQTIENLRRSAANVGESFDRRKRVIVNALRPVQRDADLGRMMQGWTDSLVDIDRMMTSIYRDAQAPQRHVTCAVPLEQLAADPPATAFVARAAWRRLTAARGHQPMRGRPGGGARGILRRAA